MSYEPLSEGWNPLWPKHALQPVVTCDQQIRGAGMQQYLCFFMPFFCSTDPLFFWLPPSASASLKLDSDPPSQDSSESKPEEDTRAPITAGLRTKPQSCPNWSNCCARRHISVLNHHSLSHLETNHEISTFCPTFQFIIHNNLKIWSNLFYCNMRITDILAGLCAGRYSVSHQHNDYN